MHKLKSQEYLDKIIEAFNNLHDPAHEIEIDSLLGYIRIFYSTVKNFPTTSVYNSDDHIKSSNSGLESAPVINQEEKTSIPESNISKKPNEDEFTTLKPEIPESKPELSSIMPVEPLTQEEEIKETHNIPKIVENSFQEIPKQEPAVNPEGESVPEPESQIVKVESSIPLEEIKPTEIITSTDEDKKELNVQPPQDNVLVAVPIIDHNISKHPDSMLSKIESQQEKKIYIPESDRQFESSDAIDAIFRDKSPTGLVDFLGLSPLSDLTKAWGLNEKMLVIKDLFHDDFNAFNQTVDTINKMTTFEEAKAYLIPNIVLKYEWNDVAKFKKASDFVKQVKRLFVK